MSAICTNCDSELKGPFCEQCGQPSRSRRAPFWRMVAEASEDVITFDSKFYKSVFQLLIQPGQLSQQFISGKRVAILPPIRMYLVISLAFFLVFQIPSPDVTNENVYIGDVLIGYDQPIEGQPTYRIFSFGKEDKVFGDWFKKTFADKEEEIKSGNPQVVVDRIFNNLEDSIPKILIIFLPIFALVLKLLYLFKRVLYFDHLIFSLHFQSWLMGMILIIYALALQNPWWSALSAVIPIYLAKAQKVVYQQSYWLVIPKTFVILIVYVFLVAVVIASAFLAAIAFL